MASPDRYTIRTNPTAPKPVSTVAGTDTGTDAGAGAVAATGADTVAVAVTVVEEYEDPEDPTSFARAAGTRFTAVHAVRA